MTEAKSTSWLPLILGLVLFSVSNGNMTIPICAWLAPVFLIRFLSLKKPAMGSAVLFPAMILLTWVMLRGIIPPSLGALAYVLTFYYALLWFLPYLIHRLTAVRLSGFSGTLIFPLTGVGLDFLNTTFFGSWGSVAYSQFDNLPLIQIASITGMWGITFLVLWFGPVVARVWERGLSSSRIKGQILAVSALLLSVLVFGGGRLGISRFTPTVRIGSLTATAGIDALAAALRDKGYDSTVSMAGEAREELGRLLDSHYEALFQATGAVFDSGARLVFWPEGMTRVLEEAEARFLEGGQRLALAEGGYLLLAYLVLPSKDLAVNGENKCVLINPEGRIEWHYIKSHPVPGSPDKAGDGILPVTETPFGRISSAICYDMDFTGLIHSAGAAGVDIMIVPAWDWKAIDPLHARMAALRAVENGFSMVRHAGEGLSLAVSPLGRTLASMDHFASHDHVMISEVPVRGLPTPYRRAGDLFAWICLAGWLVLVVKATGNKKKSGGL